MHTELTKFTCTYCGKAFSRERTLQVHMCEPKRRHLQKNEKWVQNGFIVFQRFYEVNQKNAKPRTYDDFCSSQYYNAFVKFGELVKLVRKQFVQRTMIYVYDVIRKDVGNVPKVILLTPLVHRMFAECALNLIQDVLYAMKNNV